MTRYDQGICFTMDPEELEKTFWYPGPGMTRNAPGAPALRAWGKAKAICAQCPVKDWCRDYHRGEDYGVYGGLDQRERYLARRAQRRAFLTLSPEEQEAINADLLKRSRIDSPETVARRTGYSEQHIQTLLIRARKEAEEAQAARRAELAAAAALAAESEPEPEAIEWPAGWPEMGDGWIYLRGVIHSASYVAQTEDGAYFRMKLRGVKGMPMMRWFEARHVSMRAEVVPAYGIWNGRRDRRAKDQRAGERRGSEAA